MMLPNIAEFKGWIVDRWGKKHKPKTALKWPRTSYAVQVLEQRDALASNVFGVAAVHDAVFQFANMFGVSHLLTGAEVGQPDGDQGFLSNTPNRLPALESNYTVSILGNAAQKQQTGLFGGGTRSVSVQTPRFDFNTRVSTNDFVGQEPGLRLDPLPASPEEHSTPKDNHSQRPASAADLPTPQGPKNSPPVDFQGTGGGSGASAQAPDINNPAEPTNTSAAAHANSHAIAAATASFTGKLDGLPVIHSQPETPVSIGDPDGDEGGSGGGAMMMFMSGGSSPSASDDAYSTDEDAPLVVNSDDGMLGNDSGPEGTEVISVTDPEHGTLTWDADGSFTYTPDANFNGEDSFIYTISDGENTSEATVTLTINAVNDTPSSVDDTYDYYYGQLGTTTFTADASTNDSDPDGEGRTYTLLSDATSGSVAFDPWGSFHYTPDDNTDVTDSFTYRATDSHGAYADATVTVHVHANHTPIVQDDEYNYNYGAGGSTTFTADPTLNDSEPDGDGGEFSIVSGPAYGAVTMDPWGSFHYTPDENLDVDDSFIYQHDDGRGGVAEATVTIHVHANHIPVAGDDEFTGRYYLPGGGTIGGNLYPNDSDADPGTSLGYYLVSGPSNGTLELHGWGDFIYTPGENATYDDSFVYEVRDGSGGVAQATVTIHVLANHAPVAGDDEFTGRYYLLGGGTIGGNLYTNDSDADPGTSLGYYLVSGPTNGTLEFHGWGDFIYTPGENATYDDTFVYEVRDGSGGVAQATVTIHVLANHAPVAGDDEFTGRYYLPGGGTIGGNLYPNDSDADAGTSLGFYLVSGPTNGTLELHGWGDFIYTPGENATYDDLFVYEVRDGSGGVDQATVTIHVLANHAPVAGDDEFTGRYYLPGGGTIGGNLYSNDSDADPGTSLGYYLVSGPSNGTLELHGWGDFIYTPGENATYDDSFVYEVRDGSGGVAQATVTIHVLANHAPVAGDDEFTGRYYLPGGGTIGGNLYSNDSDADAGTSLGYYLVSGPTNGTLEFHGWGDFIYTPGENATYDDSFVYEVRDGSGGVDQATVIIHVLAETPPVASDGAMNWQYSITGESLHGGLWNYSSDADPGTSLGYYLVSGPTNGTLEFYGWGEFYYTPADNDTYDDSFIFEVRDGSGGADQAAITIHVTANGQVNLPPIAGNDSYSVQHGSGASISGNVLDNDSDPENGSLTIVGHTNPQHGALSLSSDGSFLYTPQTGYVGADSFFYTVEDNHGHTSVATVSLTALNTAPVAHDMSITINRHGASAPASVSPAFDAEDANDDALTFEAVGGPQHGTLVIHADGTFTYTVESGYLGVDSFTYRCFDGYSYSNVATVSISIVFTNAAPVAGADDGFSVTAGNSLTIAAATLLANDADDDEDDLSITSFSYTSNHGALIRDSSGDFVYTPTTGFSGPDSFSYTITDGFVTATAVVSITVTPAATVIAADDNFSVAYGGSASVVGNVLANDTSSDSATLAVYWHSEPMHGTLEIGEDGAFTYTPDADFAGEDSFRYRIQNENGQIAEAVVHLTVENAAPIASDHSYNLTEDRPLTIAANAGLLSGAADADGDEIWLEILSGPEHGTFYADVDGSFIYRPETDFNGIDSVTYQVVDAVGGLIEATATFNIAPANDPPTTVADQYSMSEDGVLTVDANAGVLQNDFDIDSVNLSTVLFAKPAHGSVVWNADGSFVYTPDADFSGTDSWTYLATDGAAYSNIGSVVVSVTAANDAPLAQGDTLSTREDLPLTIVSADLLGNDRDADGDNMSVVIVHGPEHGELTPNGQGTFIYTPSANFHGSDSFSYAISDGHTTGNTAIVSIGVASINDAPSATNLSASIAEDASLSFSADDLIAGAHDVDGDSLSVIIVGLPANGLLSVDEDGIYTYVPNANFGGEDDISFVISDGHSFSNTATYHIVINSVYDAPHASNDVYEVTENGTLQVFGDGGLLANDANLDSGASFAVVSVADPLHGTISWQADGSFTYTPTPGFHGSDSFTYVASDGVGPDTQATVSIAVLPESLLPVATDDNYAVDSGSTLVVTATSSLITNDFSNDAGSLAAYLVGKGPQHGTLVLNRNGTFTYRSDANFSGSDTFTYNLRDRFGRSAGSATVTIDVHAGLPRAADDVIAVEPNSSVYLGTVDNLGAAFLANDVDPAGGQLAVVIQGQPSNGSLQTDESGNVYYVPNQDFTGTDSISYRASNGNSQSNLATVTIVVADSSTAAAPPVALSPSFEMNENGSLSVGSSEGLLAGATSPDGGAIRVILVTPPSSGALNFDPADGSFTFIPDGGFQGTVTIGFKPFANGVLGDLATATITVNAVNQVPEAAADSFSVGQNGLLRIPSSDLLDNDRDRDSYLLSLSIHSGPQHGELDIEEDGTIVYTPAAGFAGADSFTYTLSDGTDESNVATVYLTVSPIEADADSYTIGEDESLAVDARHGLLANDANDASLGLHPTVLSGPSHGDVSVSPDGSFTYTPQADFFGTDSFTYRLEGNSGASDETTVTIEVVAANDPPVPTNDAYAVGQNGALTINAEEGVLSNDLDADGDELQAFVSSAPLHGTLVFSANGSFQYTPFADFVGTDSFSYWIADGKIAAGPATVSIVVSASNHAPVAADVSLAAEKDAPLVFSAYSLISSSNDADGDYLVPVVVAGPSHGTLQYDASSDSFTYQPEAGFEGSDSFTFKVSDGVVGSGAATATILVGAFVATPEAADRLYSVNEDGVFVVSAAEGVLSEESGGSQGTLSAAVLATPSFGSLLLNLDGSFTYVPGAEFQGEDSFVFESSNGTNSSAPSIVRIVVNPIAHLPTASAVSYVTDEGSPLVVSILDGLASRAHDDDGDSLTATIVSGPAHGVLSANSDGSFMYTPDANFSGMDRFTFKISAGDDDTSVVNAVIRVAPVKDAPVTAADEYSLNEDGVLVVTAAGGLLSNDENVDSLSLTTTVVVGPSHGTLSLDNDGAFRYTPETDFNGIDYFYYQASDGDLTSGITPVVITVASIVDAPRAEADAYTTSEDQSLSAAGVRNVLDNDSDPDGTAMTAELVTTTANGTLAFHADGTFDYAPNAGFHGTDVFQYRAIDGALGGEVATVTITVIATNHAPLAVNHAYAVTEDGSLAASADRNVLAGAADPDGDEVSAVLVRSTLHGSLVLYANGTFTYTPQADFSGQDSFTFKTTDSALVSNTATVTLTVNGANDAPVAENDYLLAQENTSLTFSAAALLVNDTDPDRDTLAIASIGQPGHGSITQNSDGSYLYTPESGFSGQDIFTYAATDGETTSSLATVVILVMSSADADNQSSANFSGFVWHEDLNAEVEIPQPAPEGSAPPIPPPEYSGTEFDPTTDSDYQSEIATAESERDSWFDGADVVLDESKGTAETIYDNRVAAVRSQYTTDMNAAAQAYSQTMAQTNPFDMTAAGATLAAVTTKASADYDKGYQAAIKLRSDLALELTNSTKAKETALDQAQTRERNALGEEEAQKLQQPGLTPEQIAQIFDEYAVKFAQLGQRYEVQFANLYYARDVGLVNLQDQYNTTIHLLNLISAAKQRDANLAFAMTKASADEWEQTRTSNAKRDREIAEANASEKRDRNLAEAQADKEKAIADAEKVAATSRALAEHEYRLSATQSRLDAANRLGTGAWNDYQKALALHQFTADRAKAAADLDQANSKAEAECVASKSDANSKAQFAKDNAAAALGVATERSAAQRGYDSAAATATKKRALAIANAQSKFPLENDYGQMYWGPYWGSEYSKLSFKAVRDARIREAGIGAAFALARTEQELAQKAAAVTASGLQYQADLAAAQQFTARQSLLAYRRGVIAFENASTDARTRLATSDQTFRSSITTAYAAFEVADAQGERNFSVAVAKATDDEASRDAAAIRKRLDDLAAAEKVHTQALARAEATQSTDDAGSLLTFITTTANNYAQAVADWAESEGSAWSEYQAALAAADSAKTIGDATADRDRTTASAAADRDQTIDQSIYDYNYTAATDRVEATLTTDLATAVFNDVQRRADAGLEYARRVSKADKDGDLLLIAADGQYQVVDLEKGRIASNAHTNDDGSSHWYQIEEKYDKAKMAASLVRSQQIQVSAGLRQNSLLDAELYLYSAIEEADFQERSDVAKAQAKHDIDLAAADQTWADKTADVEASASKKAADSQAGWSKSSADVDATSQIAQATARGQYDMRQANELAEQQQGLATADPSNYTQAYVAAYLAAEAAWTANTAAARIADVVGKETAGATLSKAIADVDDDRETANANSASQLTEDEDNADFVQTRDTRNAERDFEIARALAQRDWRVKVFATQIAEQRTVANATVQFGLDAEAATTAINVNRYEDVLAASMQGTQASQALGIQIENEKTLAVEPFRLVLTLAQNNAASKKVTDSIIADSDRAIGLAKATVTLTTATAKADVAHAKAIAAAELKEAKSEADAKADDQKATALAQEKRTFAVDSADAAYAISVGAADQSWSQQLAAAEADEQEAWAAAYAEDAGAGLGSVVAQSQLGWTQSLRSAFLNSRAGQAAAGALASLATASAQAAFGDETAAADYVQAVADANADSNLTEQDQRVEGNANVAAAKRTADHEIAVAKANEDSIRKTTAAYAAYETAVIAAKTTYDNNYAIGTSAGIYGPIAAAEDRTFQTALWDAAIAQIRANGNANRDWAVAIAQADADYAIGSATDEMKRTSDLDELSMEHTGEIAKDQKTHSLAVASATGEFWTAEATSAAAEEISLDDASVDWSLAQYAKSIAAWASAAGGQNIPWLRFELQAGLAQQSWAIGQTAAAHAHAAENALTRTTFAETTAAAQMTMASQSANAEFDEADFAAREAAELDDVTNAAELLYLQTVAPLEIEYVRKYADEETEHLVALAEIEKTYFLSTDPNNSWQQRLDSQNAEYQTHNDIVRANRIEYAVAEETAYQAKIQTTTTAEVDSTTALADAWSGMVNTEASAAEAYADSVALAEESRADTLADQDNAYVHQSAASYAAALGALAGEGASTWAIALASSTASGASEAATAADERHSSLVSAAHEQEQDEEASAQTAIASALTQAASVADQATAAAQSRSTSLRAYADQRLSVAGEGDFEGVSLAAPESKQQVFGVGAAATFYSGLGFSLVGEPSHVDTGFVRAPYLPTYGYAPALGLDPFPDEPGGGRALYSAGIQPFFPPAAKWDEGHDPSVHAIDHIMQFIGESPRLDLDDSLAGVISQVAGTLPPFDYSVKIAATEFDPDSGNVSDDVTVTDVDRPILVDRIMPHEAFAQVIDDASARVEGELAHLENDAKLKELLAKPIFPEAEAAPLLVKHRMTKDELLNVFKLFIGKDGETLLKAFEADGNEIIVDDMLFYSHYATSGYFGSNITITIDPDVDPLIAANYLLEDLLLRLPFYKWRLLDEHLTNDLKDDAKLQQFLQGLRDSGRVAARAGADYANAYLAVLGVANEPFDVVLSASEVSEGNHAAIAGLLPIIPWQFIKKLVVVVGGKAYTFTNKALQAIVEIRTVRGFANRWNSLTAKGLTLDQLSMLADVGYLKVPVSYKGGISAYAKIVPKPSYVNPQVHHDLPWTFKDWFLQHGVNPANPEYMRWVQGTPPGQHQNWTPAFEAEWRLFMSRFPTASRDEIVDFMKQLRASGLYP